MIYLVNDVFISEKSEKTISIIFGIIILNSWEESNNVAQKTK